MNGDSRWRAVTNSRARALMRAGALAVSIIIAAVATGCGVAPERAAPRPPERATPIVALVGGRVQAAPDAPVIPDGVVLVDGATISAIGARTEFPVPPGATVIECGGATVLAGFWNSHVHFTEPIWNDAATAPADRLAAALRAMLTSYGVVAVLDTGSFPGIAQALRTRIASGEIPGPSIMIAGGSFVPQGASPYYVLPARLPELTSPAATAAMADSVLDGGADGIKLFTGSWATRSSIVVMDGALVRAATTAAHRRGKFAIAHPSNSAGARVAIENGVDILAHTFPTELDRRPWDAALPPMMLERRMALVPTLKLFPSELRKAGAPSNVGEIVLGIAQAQLRAFADGGGQVLFGTDIGYMPDYDPTDEYVFMQQAGLSYPRILASLTTAPAERFGVSTRTGRLARGLAADVAVVEGDPASDIRALARVRYTLRAGRVIYARNP